MASQSKFIYIFFFKESHFVHVLELAFLLNFYLLHTLLLTNKIIYHLAYSDVAIFVFSF